MTTETAPAPTVPAFRPFAVRVARVRRLGPSFLRVTFTGADLDEFASGGADQRIKVLFPLPSSGLEHCPVGDDWYAQWRADRERGGLGKSVGLGGRRIIQKKKLYVAE